MVVSKQASGVERVRLRLATAPIVPIKALPAAPLRVIELTKRMKPARRSNSKDRKDLATHHKHKSGKPDSPHFKKV